MQKMKKTMTDNNGKHILTINCGSSSIKFSLYQMENPKPIILKGEIEGISRNESSFHARDADGRNLTEQYLDIPDYSEALKALFGWFKSNKYDRNIGAVGHRIVHGGIKFREHQILNQELIEELRKLSPFDPEHLPGEIKAVEIVGHFLPDIKQVACFDTAFHRNMPGVAKLYGLPRRLFDEGIIRYGFHGLSYEYIVEELSRVAGEDAASGRIIIAHLGHGASMAAVKNRRSVDTTMGFSPTGGLVMSTRSGDLDPGVILYLLKQKGLSIDKISVMVNHEGGLLGVSEVSSSLKDILEHEEQDTHAREAVALFCYQAKKFLGSLASVLGGLETLVFTGGIGENSPVIRSRICERLEFLGITLDNDFNRNNAPVVSRKDSSVTVRVIETNEELMIARHVYEVLSKGDF